MEDFPCDNKYELKARERNYIEGNLCINKNIPNRTNKEWKNVNEEKIKEFHKIYYEKNNTKLNEKSKENRLDYVDHFLF